MRFFEIPYKSEKFGTRDIYKTLKVYQVAYLINQQKKQTGENIGILWSKYKDGLHDMRKNIP